MPGIGFQNLLPAASDCRLANGTTGIGCMPQAVNATAIATRTALFIWPFRHSGTLTLANPAGPVKPTVSA